MLYDLTGREIITQEILGTGTIDVSPLAKGAYLAKIIHGVKTYSQKLMIQ